MICNSVKTICTNIEIEFHSIAGVELFFVIHCDELEQITRHQLHCRIERLGFSHYESPRDKDN